MNNIADLMMLDVVNRQWLKREKRKEFLFMAGRYRYGLGRPDEASFVRLLLDAGANPKAQASLRCEVLDDDKHFVHKHRDATPLTWGRDFPYKLLVSRGRRFFVILFRTAQHSGLRPVAGNPAPLSTANT
jgi:hypothetical protein